MKTITGLIDVFLLLVLSLAIFTNSEAQDINNLDFEILDSTSNTGSQSWSGNTPDYTIFVDTTRSFSGNASMLIKGESNDAFGEFSQRYELDNIEEGVYHLSGKVLLGNVDANNVDFQVSVLYESDALYNWRIEKFTPTETEGWEEFEIHYLVEDPGNKIVLAGDLYGSGSVWFDDLSINKIRNENNEANSEEAENYLAEVKKIITENSIMRDSVDIEKTWNVIDRFAKGCKKTSDCYLFVRFALTKLWDRHSSFFTPSIVEEWNTAGEGNQAAVRMTEGYMIDRYAYIQMPYLSTRASTVIKTFADSTYRLIRKLDKEDPEGWIVDLRYNRGGNCWPMIAGLSGLLGNDTLGYLLNNDGDMTALSCLQGGSYLGDTLLVSISDEYFKVEGNPLIAVLIGPSTLSSGEFMAISFVGMANTRFFGEPSYGLTTGVETFELSDGSIINLTSSIMMDRNKKPYGGKIVPDIIIKPVENNSSSENDPVLLKAIDWLDGKK